MYYFLLQLLALPKRNDLIGKSISRLNNAVVQRVGVLGCDDGIYGHVRNVSVRGKVGYLHSDCLYKVSHAPSSRLLLRNIDYVSSSLLLPPDREAR